jgi:hypothetical protein
MPNVTPWLPSLVPLVVFVYIAGGLQLFDQVENRRCRRRYPRSLLSLESLPSDFPTVDPWDLLDDNAAHEAIPTLGRWCSDANSFSPSFGCIL